MNLRHAVLVGAGRLDMNRQAGFGLIELMVAITIGLLLTVAMLTLYVDVGRSNNEMSKANILMENGRFALQLLQGDVSHAGFWGEVDNSLAAPTAIPSLCAPSTWSTSGANLMGVPVQGFTSGTTLSTCNAGLANAISGESVLAVVHANTCFRGSDCEPSDTGPHFQVSTCDGVAAGTYVIASAPDSASLTLTRKNCVDSAELRKIVSNIYYVALSNNIPTLMRASLVNGSYQVEPLVEGVEHFWVEYGEDNLGRNGLAISSSNPGDGSADEYVSCTPSLPCDLEKLVNVVSVKVYLLVRSLEPTAGYTDAKSYVLGSRSTIAAKNDSFKRHVFSTTIRLVNPSSRREIP